MRHEDVSCFSRIVTGQPPCYGIGKEATMIKRQRRQHTTEQKVATLRRYLIGKIPASRLCNEYKLQPSVFYQ